MTNRSQVQSALEQQTQDFIHHLQHIYFEQRDIPAVIALLDEDIHWIGTGSQETCKGLEEAKAHLLSEQENFKGAFTILESEYDAKAITENLCGVLGSLRLHENSEEDGLLDLEIRITALCHKIGEKIYLRQLHTSVASSDQTDEEFFPRIMTDSQTRWLRRMLKEQAERLQAQSVDLKALMENIPGGVMSCMCTDELTLLQYSEGFLTMFGYTAWEIKELFGNRFIDMIYEEDREKAWADAREQLKKGNTKEIEYRIRHKDGHLMWVLDRGQLVTRKNGEQIFYCILIDTTETKKAQEELKLSLERYQIVMDQSADIVFEWDFVSDSIYFSPNWKKRFGYEPITQDITTEIPMYGHVHPKDRHLVVELIRDTRAGVAYGEKEVRIADKKGKYTWCRIRLTRQKDGKKAVGVIMDIDQEKRYAQEMEEKAQRDILTGLYNKGTLQEMVTDRLALLRQDQQAAFLIIDVDNFKQVNDLYGHLSGDAMLADVAGMLQHMVRSQDVVGRIGGDEFVVFLNGIKGKADAEKKARDILAAFGEVLKHNPEQSAFSCSVGIALVPHDASDFYSLYKNADKALYQAKTNGKHTYAFYEEGLALRGQLLREDAPDGSKVDERIDSNRKSGVLSQELAEYVFHMLYGAEDITTAIPLILEIIGKKFDVSRAYIFEDTEDGNYMNNTFEWCNEGVEPQKGMLQMIAYDELGDFYANFDEDGVFYCKDVSVLPSAQKEILECQGIKSMLQCAIRDNGKNKGFVGFDECRENRFWTQEQIDALSFVAAVVSTFLLKERAQGSTEEMLRCLETILDSQDAFIYVVEKGTFNILYANDKTRRVVGDLGAGITCHQAFYASDVPCSGCPSLRLDQDTKMAQDELYSEVLQKKVYVRANTIPWVGGQNVFLMTCYELEENGEKPAK